MKNGDLSNEAPKRILVHTDVFTVTTVKVTKKFKVFPKVSHDVRYDRVILSNLYLFATNSGVTLEMVSDELNQSEMDLLHDELDRLGTNPFRYATSYKSLKELVAQLPYRPEVVGVCDVPSRQLMYGHWSYNFG